MFPEGGVRCGGIEVAAGGRQSDQGMDVQQAEDPEQQLRRESLQTERHRQRHRWENTPPPSLSISTTQGCAEFSSAYLLLQQRSAGTPAGL